MANFKDVIKGIFREENEEDDYVLPLDESGRLIRPMGTVRAVAHSFKTHDRSGGDGQEAQAALPDKLPLDDESRALLEIADAVRGKAYAKYSGFRVGAALVGASGQVVSGPATSWQSCSTAPSHSPLPSSPSTRLVPPMCL